MLINLTDVLSCEEKVVKRTVETELRSFDISLGSFPLTEERPLTLVLTNLGKDKLLIEGEFAVKAQIPCDRCLEQVLVEIPYSIERKLDMKQSDEDRVEDLDENDYLTGMDLDVDRLVYLEVLMSWPLKVLCKEDCKGICSRCGKNLNEGPCGCAEEPKDPRMAAISDIFSKFKEV